MAAPWSEHAVKIVKWSVKCPAAALWTIHGIWDIKFWFVRDRCPARSGFLWCVCFGRHTAILWHLVPCNCSVISKRKVQTDWVILTVDSRENEFSILLFRDEDGSWKKLLLCRVSLDRGSIRSIMYLSMPLSEYMLTSVNQAESLSTFKSFCTVNFS